MGFLDEASDLLGKGMNAAKDMVTEGAVVAKGAVAGMAVEQRPFMKAFVRMCSDGWAQGWNERNGGNASYRMTVEEAAACKPYFYDTPSSWVPLKTAVPQLGGAFFACTAAGSFMRNLAGDVAGNMGIVELSEAGDSWRVVWGFKDGGRPTSELEAHLACHRVRMEVTYGVSRVVYHAHPAHTVALSLLLPATPRALSKALWCAMTECAMVFPEGVGAVDVMVPGGEALAQATAREAERHGAVVWAAHGLLVTGATFDEAFGLMHTIEKAAQIRLLARAADGGSAQFDTQVSDDTLRAIAASVGKTLDESLL